MREKRTLHIDVAGLSLGLYIETTPGDPDTELGAEWTEMSRQKLVIDVAMGKYNSDLFFLGRNSFNIYFKILS